MLLPDNKSDQMNQLFVGNEVNEEQSRTLTCQTRLDADAILCWGQLVTNPVISVILYCLK